MGCSVPLYATDTACLFSFVTTIHRGIYSATKAAVLRLSDALRLECRPLRISVLLVAPGFIDTKARATAKVAKRFEQQFERLFLGLAMAGWSAMVCCVLS